MPKLIFLIAFLCSSIALVAQQDVKQLIEEGVALHDKQDFEGALKKYDEALAIDKNNYLAQYEKSLTLMYMKRYDECIMLCKWLLEKDPKNELTVSVYVTYGSVTDDKGDAKGAVKIFDKGIKQFPNNYLLYYNKGLTLNSMGETEAALETLQKGVQCKPLHASAHNAMAAIALQQNKIKALLPTIVFLAIEPEGSRAAANLKRMDAILNSNVQKKDDKNVVISLSPAVLDSKDKKNDTYRSVELMMSLTSAMDYDEKHKDETPSARLNRKLDLVIASLGTADKKKDFFAAFYGPFLSEMKNKGLLETYCHLAYASAADETNRQWLKEHTPDVDMFYQWLRIYQWPQ